MTFNFKHNYKHSIIVLTICLLFAAVWSKIPHPALIVVMSVIPLGILFVLNQPFLMVLLFVLFSFFRIHEVFPQLYNFKIPLLLSLASLAALIWHLVLTEKIKPYWRKELTLVSSFFGLVILGIVMASNLGLAIKYFSDVYSKIMIMTFAIAWLSRTSKDFALASKLFTITGSMVGLVALHNSANGIGLVEGTRVTIGRAIGSILGDPNDLALVLMFPVAFSCSFILTPKIGKANRIFGITTLLILFSAVLATQSRGGLLGILTIFGFFGYRFIRSKVLFFSLGGIGATALYFMASISSRSSGGAAEEGIDESAMGRLYAWEAAIRMANENPITGIGVNNFFANYFFYSSHWDGLNHAVHSTWFGVLAETGYLGLIIFVSTIVMLVKTSLNTLFRIEENLNLADPTIHATAQATTAGLVGTIISATFLTQGFTWPIYILLSMIVAMAHWVDTNLPAKLSEKNT